MDISSISNVMAHAPAEPPAPHPLNQDQREVIQAVKAVSATEMFGADNRLTYSVDRKAQIVVVKIVNRKTGEVVDQIPAEYVLRMAEELKGS